jgi:hypothetical protein
MFSADIVIPDIYFQLFCTYSGESAAERGDGRSGAGP